MTDWSEPYVRVIPALLLAEGALRSGNHQAGNKFLNDAIVALMETRAALDPPLV